MTSSLPDLQGVILVSGVPGAGKTTVAAELASRFPLGVHVEADALQRMIVSGARWPDEEPLAEGHRQLRLRGRNACVLADSFRDAGFVAVVDDIVIGSRLDDFLEDLVSRPIYYVLLLPDLETLRERNAQRAKADVFDQARELDPVARDETRRIGLRIDTSWLSVRESVDAILSGLEPEGRIA